MSVLMKQIKINDDVAIDGKIFIESGGVEKEFEMNSFVKNMLLYFSQSGYDWAGTIGTTTDPSYAIFFSYTDSYSYDSEAISNTVTPMTTDFSHNDNGALYTNTLLNGDGSKTVKIEKRFTNISGQAKTILNVYLIRFVTTTPERRLWAKDIVNVTVAPDNNLTIRYELTFSKDFSIHAARRIQCLFSKNVSDITILSTAGGVVEEGATWYSGEDVVSGDNHGGLIIGSSTAPVVGNENSLRERIGKTKYSMTQVYNVVYPPVADVHRGYLNKTRYITNTSESAFTVGEVAHYAQNAGTRFTMTLLRTLPTPVVVQPGETIEVSVDYVLTI